MDLSRFLREVAELARAQRELEEKVSRRVVPSRAHFRLLSVLGSVGRTVPQAAGALGLTRQSVQRVADHLVELRLARFEPNPGHRRSPMLRPTEEGIRARERIERELSGWESRVGDAVEPEELETAGLVLRALRTILER